MADLTKAEFGDVLTLFCLFNIQVLLIESKKISVVQFGVQNSVAQLNSLRFLSIRNQKDD